MTKSSSLVGSESKGKRVARKAIFRQRTCPMENRRAADIIRLPATVSLQAPRSQPAMLLRAQSWMDCSS